jgi:hypothetical protein
VSPHQRYWHARLRKEAKSPYVRIKHGSDQTCLRACMVLRLGHACMVVPAADKLLSSPPPIQYESNMSCSKQSKCLVVVFWPSP